MTGAGPRYNWVVVEEPDSKNGTDSPLDGVIGTLAPVLDLVLAVGDRVSRLLEPVDHDYYPIGTEESDE